MKAAQRMAGPLPELVGGMERYPKTSEVLAAAGLHTIAHYIQVRRHSIVQRVANRPIFEMCQLVERSCGTTPRIFCWEQPMDLDKASGGDPPAVVAEGNRGVRPHSLATGPGSRAT